MVGATGATGRLLVERLLDRGEKVKAIVRSPEKLPTHLRDHPSLSVVHADLLDLDDQEMTGHVAGCTAVFSCLGHTMSLQGIYGPPRRLVTEATRRLCAAVRSTRPAQPVRFVLMNTAGNRDRGLDERVTFGERCVIVLMRLLLPPHADNEEAADHLRQHVGHEDDVIEWVVVRPDTLTDGPEVTEYEVHPSPVRSALFDPGRTSRINVAHFMAELIGDEATWRRWSGQMPVIYDKEPEPRHDRS